MRRVLGDSLLERVQLLRPLAEAAGMSMAQLAIAWTLQDSTMSCAIIGASKPEHIVENVEESGIKLEASLMSRIDEVLGDMVDRDHAKTATTMAVRQGWAQPIV